MFHFNRAAPHPCVDCWVAATPGLRFSQIVEIEPAPGVIARLKQWEGNYSAYVTQKELALLRQLALERIDLAIGESRGGGEQAGDQASQARPAQGSGNCGHGCSSIVWIVVVGATEKRECAGGGAQRSSKTGLRFSRKAAMPSFWSRRAKVA